MTRSAGRSLLFAGLNLLYGGAFLGLALGLSMGLSSGRRVTAAAFGVYVVFVMLWELLVEAFVLVLWRFDGGILLPGNLPDWAFFVRMASPSESYERLVTALFDSEVGAFYTLPDAPWFVDAPVAVLVLLAWVFLPLWLGYLRFRRVDL